MRQISYADLDFQLLGSLNFKGIEINLARLAQFAVYDHRKGNRLGVSQSGMRLVCFGDYWVGINQKPERVRNTAEISTDWLSRIWERSASNDVAPKAPGVQSEKEPNDSPPQAFDVPVPAIIEGTIDRPGDADWFGFEAKEGDRLAFEVETPYLPPPFFNPLLSVFDQEGRELVDNIYRATDACGGEGIKTLMPSTLFRIEKAGRYRIRIQDLTARVGGAKFAYRVLIRRQIAYLGEVSASELDRISLQARGSRSVNLAAEFEEGFAGEAVVSVENLPPGISAATKFSASGKGDAPASKPGNPTHKERYMPERRSVEIMLIAAANAPATVLPQPIRIVARPIMNGKVGAALPAQEILLTVSGRKEQTNAALR